MSEVRLVGIAKHYEGTRATRPAIEHLDLVIPSGELAVLVGPSGCGKSTTLRIVAGLEEPTSGQVFIGDREVTHVPPARRDIAMVFQSYALYPHMTVRDNMAFALRIRKTPAAEIAERVEAAARSLGLSEYLDRRPKALSGGQRQRVAIGRAVVRDPKVFLFDEPLSNLDAKLRGEMRREIARIHAASSATSLYVTHDQIEAMTLADRIVVLRDGAVQQVGSPSEIYGAPANRFVAGFFGAPAMNFLTAELGQDSGALTATGPGFAIRLNGDEAARAHADSAASVILGVRPESITLEERPGAMSVETKVVLREMLGAEIVLYLDSEAGALTLRADARAQGASSARPGDSVTVWMHHDSVHLFDAATERRL